MPGIKLNGKYIGIDPNDHSPQPKVYADRDNLGAWEDWTLTYHPEGYYDALNTNTKLQLSITDLGKLESRPLGWVGAWEQLTLSDDNLHLRGSASTLILDLVGFEGSGFLPGKQIHLEQRGWDFVDTDGQRIVLPGCDGFLALRQYRDGGPDALKPFFQQSARLGTKVWRIWSQGSKKQNTIFNLSPTEAGYYDSINPFAKLCNQNGIIPLITAFVDNQDVQSPVEHFYHLGERLAGTQSLLSGFNQWSKNKSNFDPWALGPPAGNLIWSRGSDVDDTITDPKGAPASELHATRNSFDRALMDSTASPPFMRSKGAGMVWMTEGNPFGDSNGYNKQQAWQIGRGYSIQWALAVFHDRQSQRGELMHDDTVECCQMFNKGMAL